MTHDNCQNCGEAVTANYCAYCGQRADTHRFSTKHIFTHDFIHGAFHLDKGFFYTAKELLLRPGYSVREYIEGKRVNHYNYITFMLLLISANVFIYSSFHIQLSNMGNGNKAALEQMQNFLLHHMREMQLIVIPFNAAVTYLLFRRAKQNYAEHLVMNTYKEAGALMINTIVLLLVGIIQNPKWQLILQTITLPLILIYYIKFYKQYFSKDYSNKFWLNVRAVFALQVVPLIVLLLAGFITYYFINKELVLQILEAFAS